ncbi:MAG: S-adenosyl-L-homocysteine hydrolase [Sulfitobacter sp.]
MKATFTIAAAALLSVGTAASAQVTCMPAPQMEASLIDWYGETPVEGSAEGNMVVWASTKTGTWSLLRYQPDGQTCVIETGTDWNQGAADPQTSGMS